MKTYELLINGATDRRFEYVRADEISWQANGLVIFYVNNEIVFMASTYTLLYIKPQG